jgi:hypothetical protein
LDLVVLGRGLIDLEREQSLLPGYLEEIPEGEQVLAGTQGFAWDDFLMPV